MKNNIVLFTGCIMMLMASCLNSDDTNTLTLIKDAQISSMVLSHDSIEGLKNVKFTIDQLNGLIFNNDSLPYGTEVGKVLCTLSYAVGVGGTRVAQEATGDTIWWNGTDSLDFSKTVKFITTAYDGQTTKTYTAKVNIHQEIPELMVWQLYAGRMIGERADEQKVVKHLYSGTEAYLMYTKTNGLHHLHYTPATDLKTWNELSLTGLPATADISQITPYENVLYLPAADGLYRSADGQSWTKVGNSPVVKVLLGTLKAGRNTPSLLASIIETGSTYAFAGMNKEQEWTEGKAVPDDFPFSGFGNVNYNRMNEEYLTVVAGKNRQGGLLNTTWTTENATEWFALSGGTEELGFEKKTGAMLAVYDGKFFLTGGINEEGKASKDIHFSIDNGLTWTPADSLKALPDEYLARGYASIHLEADNFMLIFGGKTSMEAKPLDELWRGRINRLK